MHEHLESSKIHLRIFYWSYLPKEFILNLKIYEKLVYIMEEVIVNNMEMDDIYEEEQLNQIEMKESEKNNAKFMKNVATRSLNLT